MTGEIVVTAANLLLAAADHVRAARREEAALGRKLDTGLFGAASAGRPWPEHDAALCREISYEATRAWLFAVECLLDALLSPDRSLLPGATS